MTKSYTSDEVKAHTTTNSCWIVYNNQVYDVTDFILDHPGGEELILDYAGKDVTAVMKDVLEHEHSEAAYEILAECRIGTLIDEKDEQPMDKEARHRQRMKLLDEEKESETYGRADFHPSVTDVKEDVKINDFLDLTKPLIPQLYVKRFTKEFYLEQVHKPRYLPTPAIFFGYRALEPLTKTAWYVVPILWLPCVGYQILRSLSFGTYPAMLSSFGLGLIIWTLLEYLLHRFLFHVDDYLPDHQIAFLLHFTLHGFHHYLPMDRLRLVMPPALGLLLAYPLVSLGHVLFPPAMAHGVIAGSFVGYILYDCTHYYLHHAKVFGEHFREMKKYHMAHHYKNYEDGYGITSKIWDYVFGTTLLYK